MFDLTGKQAVITGAASGIGLAIAELFAVHRADVTLVDLDGGRVAEVAGNLARETGALTKGMACDVSRTESVSEVFAAIGRVDILVNCAGIAHVGTILSTTPEDLDRLYAVNVRGTYLCMKAAVAPMVQARSGVILNMASIAATAGLADRFAYSMTKGAVLSMTLSAARDYLSSGIRCLCISPARVHTPFVDNFLAKNYPGGEAQKFQELANSQPIGRMGKPAEIATLALYLCSDEASFLTGVDYPIDGGFFNLR